MSYLHSVESIERGNGTCPKWALLPLRFFWWQVKQSLPNFLITRAFCAASSFFFIFRRSDARMPFFRLKCLLPAILSLDPDSDAFLRLKPLLGRIIDQATSPNTQWYVD